MEVGATVCERQCCNCGKTFMGYSLSRYCSEECHLHFNLDKSVGPDECWTVKLTCINSTTKRINTFMRINGRCKRAQVFSYELHHGAIPEGAYVYNTCGNLICANPAHLALEHKVTCMRKCHYCDKPFKSVKASNKYCSVKCYFEHHVDKTSDPNGCWLWKGTRFGRIFMNYNTILMSKYSYEQYHNLVVPDNMFMIHLCNNSKCVNPEHLSISTCPHNGENTPKGEDNPHAKLTEEQVKEIYLSKLNSIALSKKYNVHARHIRRIRSDERWKHITKDLDNPRKNKKEKDNG